MSAIGKVMTLDAEHLLDDPATNPHAGLVLITITCTLEQSRAWGELWGRDVQALPFIPPAEPTTPPSGQVPLNLEPEKP